jgi:ribonuclease HI
MVTIYTDGGNSSKHKLGGCSAVITKDNMILAELSQGYDNNPTNNMMELGGVILGCQYMLDHPELGKDVTIISDSEYVVNGSTVWLPNWKLRNWKATTGPVKNKVLWEAIDYLKTVLNITFRWTKGHSNNTLNNLADELAVKAYTVLIK